MATVLTLLVLALCLSAATCLFECCPEDNLLSLETKLCTDNSTIALSCELKFASPPDNFNRYGVYLHNGALIANKTNKKLSYCHAITMTQLDHLYIFCIPDERQPFDDVKIQVGAILGYVSVAFIILTIIVYTLIPELLDLQGICILHALMGMVVGYTFLGAIQLKTDHDSVTCQSLGFVTYFGFLYLFFWLVTLSFHIWKETVKPKFLCTTDKWPILYHVFAIGGPVFFLLVLINAHLSTWEFWDSVRPGIGKVSCWFETMRETIIYFYGPVTVLLSFNVFFYLWTILVLWGEIENRRHKVLKYRVKMCVKLCIIMGLTWIIEIVTAALKDPEMSVLGKILLFLLDLCNIIQGVLVFLVLVVFRKRVRRKLANKRWCFINFPNSWKNLEDEELIDNEQEIFEQPQNCTELVTKNEKNDS